MGVSIRFHVPKRFHDRLEGIDPAQLVGSFLMSSERDVLKWQNSKDKDKSSSYTFKNVFEKQKIFIKAWFVIGGVPISLRISRRGQIIGERRTCTE